jgi:hypothetical protein
MQGKFTENVVLQERAETMKSSAKSLLAIETPVLIPIETMVDFRIEVYGSKVHSSTKKSSSEEVSSSTKALARKNITWPVVKVIKEKINSEIAEKVKSFFKISDDKLFPVLDKDWELIWSFIPTESPIRFNVILEASVKALPGSEKVIIRQFAIDFVDILEDILRERKLRQAINTPENLYILNEALKNYLKGQKYPFRVEISLKPGETLQDFWYKLKHDMITLNFVEDKQQDSDKQSDNEKEELSYEEKKKIVMDFIKEFILSQREKIYRDYSLYKEDKEEIIKFVVELLLNEAGNEIAKSENKEFLITLKNYLVVAFNDFVFQELIYENISTLQVESIEIIETRLLSKVMKEKLSDEEQKYIRKRGITENDLLRYLFYLLSISSMVNSGLIRRLSSGKFSITLEELLDVLNTRRMKSEILVQSEDKSQPDLEILQDYEARLQEAAKFLLNYYSKEKLIGESKTEGESQGVTWGTLADALQAAHNKLDEILGRLLIKGETESTSKDTEKESSQGTEYEATSVIEKGESLSTGKRQQAGSKKKKEDKAKKGEKQQEEKEKESEFLGGSVQGYKFPKFEPESEEEKLESEPEEETAASGGHDKIKVSRVVSAKCEEITGHFADEISKIVQGSSRVKGKDIGFNLTFDGYSVIITIDKMERISSKKERFFPIIRGSIYISVPSLGKISRAFIPFNIDNLVRNYLWRQETKIDDDVEKPITVQFDYALYPRFERTASGISVYYDIDVDFGGNLKEKIEKETDWQILLVRKGRGQFQLELKSFKEKEEMFRKLPPERRRGFLFRIGDDSVYIAASYKFPSFIVDISYARAFYDLLNRFIEKYTSENVYFRTGAQLIASKVKEYIEEFERGKYSTTSSKNTGVHKMLVISNEDEMNVIYAIAYLVKVGKLKLEPGDSIKADKNELKQEYELLRGEIKEISRHLEFMKVPIGSHRFDESRIKAAVLVSLRFVTRQLNATSEWLLDILSKCLLKHMSSIIKENSSSIEKNIG